MALIDVTIARDDLGLDAFGRSTAVLDATAAVLDATAATGATDALSACGSTSSLPGSHRQLVMADIYANVHAVKKKGTDGELREFVFVKRLGTREEALGACRRHRLALPANSQS